MSNQKDQTPSEPTTRDHGWWAYDADSGICLGPASYELRERWNANGGRPLTENRYGYPNRTILKERLFP